MGRQPGYQRLLQQTPVIATWDDHDYGANDAGVNYPQKEAFKEIFLNFFNKPANSDRRQRAGGIYTAYHYGPAAQRVQVILLDTRCARTPLTRVSDVVYAEQRRERIGPHTVTENDPEITMEIRAVDNDLMMQNTIRLRTYPKIGCGCSDHSVWSS